MTATVDSSLPPPMGAFGTSSTQRSPLSPNRKLSASILGPSGFSVSLRARPTTQEIIADTFGRRLHGLDLLSVKKLNALSANAARLEAHMASRAAAITRTAGSSSVTAAAAAAVADGSSSGAASAGAAPGVAASAASTGVGAGGFGTAAPSRELPTAGSFLASTYPPPDGSRGQGGGPDEPSLLASALQSPSPSLPHSPATAVRPQTGGGLTAGLPPPPGSPAASQALSQSWAAGQYDGMSSIADRGSNIVRLLALQDRVLAGAIRAQASLSMPGASGAGGGSMPGGSDGGGGARTSRFGLMSAPAGDACGGLGAVSAEEARRLDDLGIKHSTKVATAAVQLFRLTPRKQNLGDEPPTPPNTLRGDEEEPSAALQGLQSAVRKQMVKNRDFAAMSHFIHNLQEADELSLITRARNYSRQHSSRLSRKVDRAISATHGGPGDAGDAAGAAPDASCDSPHSPASSPSPPRWGASPHSARFAAAALGAAGAGGGDGGGGGVSVLLGSHPSLSMSLMLRSASAEGSRAGTRTGGTGTPRSRMGMPEESRLDLSRHPTGQSRSRDLLDGLMSAVSGGLGVGVLGSLKDLTLRSGGGLSHRGLPVGVPGSRGRGGSEDGEEGEPSGEPPFTGVYGSPESLARKVRRRGELAAVANPAGFREEAAAAEVALYREAADRGRSALARTERLPRDAIAAAELQKQVAVLHSCRPYFVPPGEAPPEVAVPLRPAASPRNLARQNTTLMVLSAPHESCFLPRAADSDGEDIVDSVAVRERQVRRDWNRVVRKDAFRGLVAREDPGVAGGGTGLGHALDACLAVVLRHKDTLKAAFTYYSMTNPSVSDVCFTMGPSEWRAFATDAGLADLASESGGAASVGGSTGGASLSASGGVQPAGSGTAAASGGVATASAAAGGGGGGRSRVPSLAMARQRVSVAGAPAAPRVSVASAPAAPRVSIAGAPPAPRVSLAGGNTAVPRITGAGANAAAAASSAPAPATAAAATGAGGGGAPTSGAAAGAGGGGGGASAPRLTPRNGERQPAVSGGGTAPGSVSHPAGAAPPAAAAALAYVHVDAVFAAVHSEADKRSVERPAGAERSLLRFEWYEALIRLAVVRHVKAGEKCGSIAAALEHMWTREVLPCLPPAALHEPNEWRVSRLFADPRVNDLLVTHADVLTALYDLFRAANPNKLIHLADWVGLLSTCGLLGEATGLTPRAAKLAFARSLCVVVDELGRWGRAVAADKCDLMEALARLAEEMAPPPEEEVAVAFREVLGLGGRGLHAAMAHPWLFYYSLLPESHLQARRLAAAEAAAASQAAAAAASAAAEAARVAAAAPAVPAAAATSAAASARSPRGAATFAGVATAATAAANLDAIARRTAAAAIAAASRLSPESSPFAGSLAAATAAAAPPLSPTWAPPSPPTPPLSMQVEALLDLLLGRLREHWECDTNEELAMRLQATARSLLPAGAQ